MRPNISNCHALPGTLLVFEGPDGSGKSTQIKTCKRLLEAEGKKVVISKWKTAPVISSFMEKIERMHKFSDRVLPETSLFLQATDFLYRIEKEVIPNLKKGNIVLLDRGLQTLIVRGLVLGMSEKQLTTGLLWWRNTIYKELFDSAKTIYFTIETNESLQRMQKRTLEEQKKVYGKRLSKHKIDGTLLALQFINTLIYSPEGEKMTRNDKKIFLRNSQKQIIDTYTRIFKNMQEPYIQLDGMKNRTELTSLLKKEVVDMLF